MAARILKRKIQSKKLNVYLGKCKDVLRSR